MAGTIGSHTHAFPSLHPDDLLLLEHLQAIPDDKFKRVKMHPYYQLLETRP